MYKNFFKRIFDIVLSLVSLVLLFFPVLLLAAAVKIDSKGPAFFRQKRVGLYKKHFMLIKLRTMPTDTPRDIPTHEFNAHDKLSRFQKFLRKYSLDEIPQLVNIFLGDMSFVGPRPALWNQFDLVEERDKYGANDIKPGLTGWAQINGRDELELDIKAKLDGEYTKILEKGGFRAFAFDIKCLFITVFAVIKHSGVAEGETDKSKKEERNK